MKITSDKINLADLFNTSDLESSYLSNNMINLFNEVLDNEETIEYEFIHSNGSSKYRLQRSNGSLEGIPISD
jgi:hypothetical protein